MLLGTALMVLGGVMIAVAGVVAVTSKSAIHRKLVVILIGGGVIFLGHVLRQQHTQGMQTGGDSFCYLRLQPIPFTGSRITGMTVTLVHRGSFPLRDVRVRGSKILADFDNDYEVGQLNLGVNQELELKEMKLARYPRRYGFNISALNRSWYQRTELYRDGDWRGDVELVDGDDPSLRDQNYVFFSTTDP